MSKKLVILLIAIALAGFIYFQLSQKQDTASSKLAQTPSPSVLSDQPQIISTKPDPLENAFISGTDIVEITFNQPIQNSGEFKTRMDPQIKYKIELSKDRKTAKIVPERGFELGRRFTLFILGDTKFDKTGEWHQEKMFHFNTIKYTGV